MRNNGEWEDIYPLSLTSFQFNQPYFTRFLKDKNGLISKLEFRNGSVRVEYQKLDIDSLSN